MTTLGTVIAVVVTCGVGADLVTMPLLGASVLLAIGMCNAHPAVPWMAAWWMVVVSGAIVCAEVLMDYLFARLDQRPRANRLRKVSWTKAQHVLSMVVTVVVVHALSANLTPLERAAALGAALVSTGVVKEGLLDRFKGLFVWLGG